MDRNQSPVEYEDMEAVRWSSSGKSLGCRPVGTDLDGRELTWFPKTQLLPGSISEPGETGTVIIPLWLADRMAQEGRV